MATRFAEVEERNVHPFVHLHRAWPLAEMVLIANAHSNLANVKHCSHGMIMANGI